MSFLWSKPAFGTQDHSDRRLHVAIVYCKSGSLCAQRIEVAALSVATGMNYDGLNVRIHEMSLADAIMFITCVTMSGFLLDVSLHAVAPFTLILDTGQRS